MKKFISLFISLMMATAMLTGCGGSQSGDAGEPAGGENDIVIAFSNGFTGNAWRASQVDAAIAYGNELKEAGKIKDFFVSNVDDTPAQITALNDFINRGVDAIVMNADAGNALTPTLQKAIDAGIIVVGTGIAGIDPGPQNVIVESDNDEYARAAANYIAYRMGGKGDVIHLYGLEGGWEGGEVRKNAVREVIAANPDMKIIAQQACNWSEADGNKAMAALLGTYGDKIGGNSVAVIGEDVSMGVLQAYKAAGVQLPVLNGEYTYGWLREWQKNPDLISAVTIYPPDTSVTWIDVAVLLLEGKEFDLDKASYNGKQYVLNIPMQYMVVRDKPNGDEPWLRQLLPTTQVRTLDEVLAEGEGKADNDCLGGHYSKDEIEAMYFKN
jgi:ribose transport system substrate-binding protein